jgi:uncharacterized protein (DUF2344 family)
MTKKEWFNEIATIIEATEIENKKEMLAFISHEVELLSKKRSSSTNKKNLENEALCEALEIALAEFDKPVTVTEFMKESNHEVATLSNQKLSSLLKKCVEDRKTIIKTVEKKKSYFSIVRE